MLLARSKSCRLQPEPVALCGPLSDLNGRGLLAHRHGGRPEHRSFARHQCCSRLHAQYEPAVDDLPLGWGVRLALSASAFCNYALMRTSRNVKPPRVGSTARSLLPGSSVPRRTTSCSRALDGPRLDSVQAGRGTHRAVLVDGINWLDCPKWRESLLLLHSSISSISSCNIQASSFIP